MLKLFNKEHEAVSALTNLKDYKIEYLLSGEDLLEFSLSICDENISLIEEEGYIRTKNNEYVIKAIDPSQDFKRYSCIVNIESIKGKSIASFDTSNNNITDTIRLAIAGTGWILADNNITKRRTVRLKNTNALEVLREVRKVFRVDFRFDAINKTIHVYEQFGNDKGIYFSDELNLVDLSIPSDTFDYATRIYPYGKDGLNISSVNGGKEYVENFQYSNKVIEVIWEDNRYTDINSLKADAEAKLNELSKPKRSYQAKITDLAKLNEEYKFLDFFLGDTITLLSKTEKFRDNQRIVKYIEYPNNPSQNTCELGNTTLTFEDLQRENEAKNNVVDNITSDNGTVDGEKVEGLPAENIKDLDIEVAKIVNLEAINIKVENLEAHNVTITGKLTAIEGEFGTIKANVGIIESLTVTHTAQINDLKANSATITQLNAVNANIDNLEVEVGKINTLLAGNLTASNIAAGTITAKELATGTITAGSGVIAEGAIGSAMISELDANKISAGTIDTSLVTIAGPNSNLRLRGNRLQVFVGIGNNQVERVSLGDVLGDGSRYGLLIRGSDGKTILMDENGVKSEGITNGSITNDKISGDTKIDGYKLNINSVVREINGATETIYGTKIDVNGTNLSAKLSQQDTTITEHKKITDSHTTSITANTNAIKLKVDTQTYTTDKTNMTNTLNKHTSDIILLNNQISLKVEQTDITNAIKDIEVGGRNLILNSTLLYDSSKWIFSNSNNVSRFEDSGYTGIKINGNGPFAATTETKLEAGKTYTLSYYRKNSTVCNLWIGIYYSDNTYIGCPGYINEVSVEWKIYTHTFTIPSDKKGMNLRIYSYTPSVDLYIRNVKIEKGNKVMDWTSAPEDITSDIDTKVSTAKAEIKITTDAISQNVSNLTTTVGTKADGSTVTTLSNKVGSLETSVNGIKGQVSSLETVTTKHTNDITGVKTDVDNVKSNVATLDINLQGITQRVSSTESNVSTVTTTANQAKTDAKTANNKIDGLNISDRNFVLKSDFFTSGSSNNTNCSLSPDLMSIWSNNVGKRVNVSLELSMKDVVADNSGRSRFGTEFTITYEDDTYGYIGCWYHLTNTPFNCDKLRISSISYIQNKKIKSFSTVGVYVQGVASGTYKVGKPKIQISDKPSDWTPAPEDVQSQIDVQTTEISNTKSKVSTIETNLSSITSRVSSVEQTQTTVNGQVTSLETWKRYAEQKITDSAITMAVVNSQNWTNATGGINLIPNPTASLNLNGWGDTGNCIISRYVQSNDNYVPPPVTPPPPTTPSDDIFKPELHVLEPYGGGLSMLIKDCSGKILFVDGGYTQNAQHCIDYMKSIGVKKITYYIITHSHSDHVEASPTILQAFGADYAIIKPSDWNRLPAVEWEWKTPELYQKFVDKCKQLNVTILDPKLHTYIKLSEFSNLKTFNSDSDNHTDYNHQSLMHLYTYKNNKVFLAGDGTHDASLSALAQVGTVDIFQAGHHGDGTIGGSSQRLIDELKPKHTIFSSAFLAVDSSTVDAVETLKRVSFHGGLSYSFGPNHNNDFKFVLNGTGVDSTTGKNTRANNVWYKRTEGWYWFKSDGNLAKNENVTINGKVYNFNSNGVCTNP